MSVTMPNNDRLLIQILLLTLLGAALWVMAPFISALLWGAILAFASWPLMRLLTRVLGGRETLAASLLTTAWILIVALPLVWLGFNLADHIRDATAFVRDVQVDGLPDAPDWLGGIPFVGERLVSWWQSSISKARPCWRRSSLTWARSATGCWRAAHRSAAVCWS